MNKNVMKKSAGILLVLGMLLIFPQAAMGATKPINTVNVQVNSRLTVGNPLPDIGIGSEAPDEGMVQVYASGRYHVSDAQWTDKSGKEVKAADEPRMVVTLEPEDVSEYYFLASYKASNIRVSSGTFVSARRDGDNLVVTLTLRPVRGKFDPPSDAYWHDKNLGEARWVKPDNTSGHYGLQLLRDEKTVYSVADVSSLSYNFYPYMTKAGKYTFKVRTVPSSDTEKKYSSKSDWLESGQLQITDRYVSDGKGQQNQNNTVKRGTSQPVGWVKKGKLWSYRYPDGSLCRGKWEMIDGQWYYFNMDGIMQTGWQSINNKWYYLYPNGQMAVGWARIDGKWYYFANGENASETQGSMAGPGWKIIGSYYYYFNSDGSMYTGWLDLNGQRYYLNTVDNSLQGAMFTGWIKRDDKTYFADTNGEIMKGWCQIDGNWYYFYPDTGEMAYSTSVDGFQLNQDGIWTK